ncbi:alpha/beta fold hydrolase [Leuconostocaceae bacterium ESL0958]|nr:alpha/beta fold hydrolase [Leuconostocaceae bacterium ESL0958]
MLFKDAQVTIEAATIPDTVAERVLDQPYGPANHQRYDLYLPAGAGPFPVILDLQGGGLLRGVKSSFKLNPSLKLVADGYAIVSMNYQLVRSDDYSFPNQIAEIRAVLANLKSRAGELKVDMEDVTLSGESSGAQLVMLAAASITAGVRLGHIAADDALASLPTIRRVIANYGPYEFDRFANQFAANGIQPKYAESGQAISFEGLALAGQAVNADPVGVSFANPANYLTPAMPPVFLLAGSADQVVPVQQSEDMAARYQRLVGRPAKQYWLAGGHHGIFDFDNDEVLTEKKAFLAE